MLRRSALYIRNGLLTIFLFTVVGLCGQTPAYLHYDVSDGLPGNIVYCAAQDERGFMWFGTDKGLACFDGTRFRTFGVKDGLPDPEVLNLKLDSKGRMWISCFRKKPCYRYKGQIFTEEKDKVLNSVDFDNSIYQFFEGAPGSIWLSGSGRKVFLMKESTITQFDIPESVNFVTSINNAVFALNKSTFYILNDSTQSFEKIADIGFRDTEIVIKGAAQAGNNIFLSIGDGVYKFEFNRNHIKLVDHKKDLSGTVHCDHLNRYWVCSTKYGAVCFENPEGDLRNAVHYLAEKKINSMFEDSQNTLWFCTAGDGVYALPETASQIFSATDGFSSNNITALAKTPNGKIIAGDDQGTICIADVTISKIADLGNGSLNRTRQLSFDSTGNIYAVTDFGVSILKGKTVEKVPNTRSAKYISITDKGLLIGLSGHLKLVNKPYLDRDRKILFPSRTTSLLRDNEDFIWLGGIEGLYSSKDSFKSNIGNDFPLLKGRVIDLEGSPDDYFWAANPENGALRIKTDRGKVVSVEKLNQYLDKPVENVQSLYYEGNGRLWLATNSGIYAIVNNRCTIHFDRYNGLPDNDVNSIVIQNDTVWAGTVSGLSKIILNRGNPNNQFSTVITGLRYKTADRNFLIHLSDSFTVSQKYNLPPDASLIELDMAGLDYSYRGNMEYNCIINKGLLPIHLLTFNNVITWVKNGFGKEADTTLISGGTLNFGVYLTPAQYEVKVWAINPNGVISALPAVCILEKIPEWYQTIWFYMVIWFVFFYILWRIARTAIENRKLQTVVSELRLQAIQSQINPHFIGNSINAIQQFFFPPDPVKASDYISIFTRLLRTTMDFSEKPFVPLQNEINYIEDYLQMIRLRFGNRFHYSVNVGEGIDIQTPFPTMLLQPILENATIHGLSPTDSSILEVSIIREANGLFVCTVTDNGLGINNSKEQKNKKETRHKSKGLLLLEKKIITLNELYELHCSLVIYDLSDKDPNQHGTQVILSYFPDRVFKFDFH